MSSSEACCHEPDGPLLTSHQRILNPTHTRFRKTLLPSVLWCFVSVFATAVVVARAVAAFNSSAAGCVILIWCARARRTGGLGAVPATGSSVSGRAADSATSYHRGSARPPQPLYSHSTPTVPGHCHLGGGKHPGLSLSWSYLTGVSHH